MSKTAAKIWVVVLLSPLALGAGAAPTCNEIDVSVKLDGGPCFGGVADGNLPVHWDRSGPRARMVAFTHVDEDCCNSDACYRQAMVEGASLAELERATPVEIAFPAPAAGWNGIESTWLGPDTDGGRPRTALYAWYHQEVYNGDCGPHTVVGCQPKIGLAKSYDDGLTWTDLGVVLRAPTRTRVPNTPNTFFCGGYGDFSAILERSQRYFYIFFSSYRKMRDEPGGPVRQGIGVARLPFADRDQPKGKVEIWDGTKWAAHDPALDQYHALEPIFPATRDWHATCNGRWCRVPACDLSKAPVRHEACPAGGSCSDAMWGPTVHWNEGLGKYVMLMNRTCSPCWSTEGHYVSFADDLGDPHGWCPPAKVDDVNDWYPHAIGKQAGQTDTLISGPARYTVGGRTCGTIEFKRKGAR